MRLRVTPVTETEPSVEHRAMRDAPPPVERPGHTLVVLSGPGAMVHLTLEGSDETYAVGDLVQMTLSRAPS